MGGEQHPALQKLSSQLLKLPVPSVRPAHAPARRSPMKLARRAGYAMFGILNGTEVNPNFVEGVAAASQQASATPVIYCDRGGTLEIVEAKKELKSRRALQGQQLPAVGQGREGWAARLTRECLCPHRSHCSRTHTRRSLIAAWQLVSSGHSVSVMKGGFGEWAANGRHVGHLARTAAPCSLCAALS